MESEDELRREVRRLKREVEWLEGEVRSLRDDSYGGDYDLDVFLEFFKMLFICGVLSFIGLAWAAYGLLAWQRIWQSIVEMWQRVGFVGFLIIAILILPLFEKELKAVFEY